MPIEKEHKEFHSIDLDGDDWHSPLGYRQDIEHKILAGTLDQESKTGNRTRLLRFKPGAHTTAPFVHGYWEEVYLIEGDLTVGDFASGASIGKQSSLHVCLGTSLGQKAAGRQGPVSGSLLTSSIAAAHGAFTCRCFRTFFGLYARSLKQVFRLSVASYLPGRFTARGPASLPLTENAKKPRFIDRHKARS
jgi:hypothetical protein